MLRSSRFLMLTAGLLALGGMGTAEAQTVLTLDTITVLVTKARQRAVDALAGVSTVQSQEIQLIQPARLQDIFAGMPGVSPVAISDDPGIGFNIRGLQDFGRVAVVVDGARQNFEVAQHGPAGKTYLDPELISEVGVARGPVSNIYGSGAIGGVVALTTKSADDILSEGEQAALEVHGIAGTNASPTLASGFFAARPSEAFDIVVGGVHRNLSDYADANGDTVVNSGSENTSGLVKARFRPAEGHEIEVGGILQQYTFDSGNPDDAESPMEYSNTVNTRLLTGKYAYASPDNPLVDFEASGFWNHGEQETMVLKQLCIVMGPPNTPCSDFTGPPGTTTGYDLDTVGFDVHNASRFDAFGLQNTVTLGADAFADRVESIGSNSGNPSAGYKMTVSGDRLAYGAFAQWLAEYGTFLDVIGALRFDGYNAESDAGSQEGTRLSPKITVGVTPVEPLTFYATYAEGYRAPSLNEAFVGSEHPGRLFRFLPNPALQPEIGKTIEAGINARFDNIFVDGDAFRGKLNVFQNDVTDYIELTRFAVGTGDCTAPPSGQGIPSTCYQYINIPQALIHGVELEADYDAGNWFVRGSATVMAGTDVEKDTPLGSVLPAQTYLMIGARFLDETLTIGPTWRYASADALANTASCPANDLPCYEAYHVFGLSLEYEPNEFTTATLVFDNIFNTQYTPFMSNNPAAGFSVKGGLKVKLAQ